MAMLRIAFDGAPRRHGGPGTGRPAQDAQANEEIKLRHDLAAMSLDHFLRAGVPSVV
jgi:hypothetical protein